MISKLTNMKNKKQKLRSDCDQQWFRIIMSKHPNCEVCGSTAVQAHHFFPKGLYGSLRYNIHNGIGLCMKCHFFHHHRGDPTIHQNIIMKRGKNWYSKLQQIACQPPKSGYLTVGYYEDKLKELTKQL